MNGKVKGIITENEVMTALSRCGISVSMPRGDNDPYDLIADVNGTLYKIQVKSPRFRYDGSFVLNCAKINRFKNGKYVAKRYEENEVDYFATCAEGQCYMIPADEVGREFTVRLDDNGRSSSHLAEDYELERVVYKLMTTDV